MLSLIWTIYQIQIQILLLLLFPDQTDIPLYLKNPATAIDGSDAAVARRGEDEGDEESLRPATIRSTASAAAAAAKSPSTPESGESALRSRPKLENGDEKGKVAARRQSETFGATQAQRKRSGWV